MQDSDNVNIMVDVDMDEYDDLLGKSNRYVTSTEKGAEKAMVSSNLLQCCLFHSTYRLKENQRNDFFQMFNILN